MLRALALSLFISFVLGQYYCVSNTGGQGLRMRGSPGTSTTTITTIPTGGRVRDLGQGLNSASGYTWRYVEYNSMQGWSANEFLTPCAGPSSPAAPAPPSLPSGGYLGCFLDNADRDLDYSWADSSMTVSKCRSHCASKGFPYAGLQYSTECRCGQQYGQFGKVSESDCNMRCGGDQSAMCGAAWRNSIYRSEANSNPNPQPPAPAPAPPGSNNNKCQQISNIALEKVQCGCPYVWGGTSCACGGQGGFDCSGIVYYSHRAAGVQNIPRTAADQMNHSSAKKRPECTAANLAACAPGDLLFYCFPGGRSCPNHVNMYVGNGKVVDCPKPGLDCQVLTRISYAKNFWGSRSYC